MFKLFTIEKKAGDTIKAGSLHRKSDPIPNSSAVYLLSGRLISKNVNRADKEVLPSKNRTGDGYSYSGEYLMEVKEDCVYRCFTPLRFEFLDLYSVHECQLKKDEKSTHSDVDYIGVVFGSLEVDGKLVESGRSVISPEGTFTIKAVEETVYCFTQKREDSVK